MPTPWSEVEKVVRILQELDSLPGNKLASTIEKEVGQELGTVFLLYIRSSQDVSQMPMERAVLAGVMLGFVLGKRSMQDLKEVAESTCELGPVPDK